MANSSVRYIWFEVAPARRPTPHEARSFARAVALLFFAILVALLLAAAVNPDGHITGVPTMILTLPWSIAVLQFSPSDAVIFLLLSLCAAINAALVYAIAKWMIDSFGRRTAIGILLAFSSVVLVPIWFFNNQEDNSRVRILNSHGRNGDPGVWVATNETGLRAMCATIDTSFATDAALAQGLVLVPDKTQAHYKDRKFLLPGGRLVEPYPANSFDMERDQAVEVERVRIIEGPRKGLEGWVRAGYLQRLLTIYAL